MGTASTSLTKPTWPPMPRSYWPSQREPKLKIYWKADGGVKVWKHRDFKPAMLQVCCEMAVMCAKSVLPEQIVAPDDDYRFFSNWESKW